VFDVMFPNLDRQHANNLWKKQLAKPPKEERDHDEDGDNVNPAT